MRSLLLAMLLIASAATISAQEVASLDLTGVTPRLWLRHPSSPPAACGKEGACMGVGSGGVTLVGGGGVPEELRADLIDLNQSEYADGDTAEIEVKLENVGKGTLRIPWSPHLADLQPVDEKAKFLVEEVQVGLFLNWGDRYSTSVGWLNLYGDPMHPGTVVTLNPGEWVRIRGQIEISLAHTGGIKLPAPELADRASVGTSFRKIEYVLVPGGEFEHITNASPKEWAGASKPIHMFNTLNAY